MSSNSNKRVLVAMSGGVDSSVAAALLQKEARLNDVVGQGYEVEGAHMLCWDGCENNGDKQDAMAVAAKLGMRFHTFDFRKEYKEAVYNYMVREYGAGRTPNPDVMCNKTIKFGIFLERALAMGFDYIATGHYVRSADGKLFAAADRSKDQSYFLWTLTQEQLKHSLFPVGNYLKSEVRETAKKLGLTTAEKKDSQGLCFVGKVDFAEFIREALPKIPGQIVDSSGKVLGEHDGAHFYTLGQRHGLNIGGSAEPLYIAEKHAETNTLVVARGSGEDILYKKELEAGNINWISVQPDFPLVCYARIRYRQPLQKCTVSADGTVVFDAPQKAVTPGQSIVWYAESGEVLGGAVIK